MVNMLGVIKGFSTTLLSNWVSRDFITETDSRFYWVRHHKFLNVGNSKTLTFISKEVIEDGKIKLKPILYQSFVDTKTNNVYDANPTPEWVRNSFFMVSIVNIPVTFAAAALEIATIACKFFVCVFQAFSSVYSLRNHKQFSKEFIHALESNIKNTIEDIKETVSRFFKAIWNGVGLEIAAIRGFITSDETDRLIMQMVFAQIEAKAVKFVPVKQTRLYCIFNCINTLDPEHFQNLSALIAKINTAFKFIDEKTKETKEAKNTFYLGQCYQSCGTLDQYQEFKRYATRADMGKLPSRQKD